MLDRRVIVVTGGGRGIGREHCLELASHGARVVVVDTGGAVDGSPTEEDPAAAVVAEISARGGEAVAERTSVTDHAAVGELVARVVERFGTVDAVVNNAGIFHRAPVFEFPLDRWEALLAVHLTGTFNVVQHACAHWRAAAERGERVTGRIVNTTSTAGLFGMEESVGYGAAKAGIAGLTVVTALEMARFGVTANAFSPIARTRMTEDLPQAVAAQRAWDPLEPGASSPLVAWLTSEPSGWLTGAVFRVDGNTVARLRPWEIDATCSYTAADGGRVDARLLDQAFRKAFGVMPRGILTMMGTRVPGT
jgi:NAD(P)-dependent dehydrogenase (short-subunit alcohol dehydrogenase family)